MESNRNAIPIRSQDLAQWRERANRLLIAVKWNGLVGSNSAPSPTSPEHAAPAWRESNASSLAPQELSLMQASRSIAQDPLILPAQMNSALQALRQGLMLGMHLSNEYTRASGLDQLTAVNKKGGLTELQKLEFRGKYQTASAVAVFVSAYSTLWELAQSDAGTPNTVDIEAPALPELFLQDPVRALDCFVFYLTAFLARSGRVQNESDFVAGIRSYVQQAVREIERRLESLSHTEAFTEQSYQLENSQFSVQGFRVELLARETTVEFNRVELSAIVGNREAKHQARRLVERLLCYDPMTRRNPMYDLGGLPSITMGFGEPGTGKSLLISAIATMLDDGCRSLEIPFLFSPMPDTVVSTYQGGSAERMMQWMQGLKDPARIVYAPIDDAENNLEDRSRPGVSAGVREVVAVFLRNTEGAYAVNRGNSLIQLFTNLPDQIDRAVLSRITDRAPIAGAVTEADFLDQDYLWYRKYHEMAPGFVAANAPEGYCFLDAQKPMKSLSVHSDGFEPKHPLLQKLVAETDARHRINSPDYFGAFFAAVKQRVPSFASRDLRNIQRAVDARVLDFDLPTEWMENPELFYRLGYDAKSRMIIELMNSALHGRSFNEVRREESLRYLEQLLVITESGRERRVATAVEDMAIHKSAMERFHR